MLCSTFVIFYRDLTVVKRTFFSRVTTPRNRGKYFVLSIPSNRHANRHQEAAFYFNSLRFFSARIVSRGCYQTQPRLLLKHITDCGKRTPLVVVTAKETTKNGGRSSRRVRLDSAFRSNTYWYEENREPPFRLTQQTSRAFGSKGYFRRYHDRVEVGGYYQERRPIEPFESNFEETTKLPLQWSKDRVAWQTLDRKGITLLIHRRSNVLNNISNRREIIFDTPLLEGYTKHLDKL